MSRPIQAPSEAIAAPLVSVIVPVFNGEDVIGRALDSVFGQSFDRAFEVIIVNDGSTDATCQVLGAYQARIRMFHQPNAGPARSRNVGAALARGMYLAFLDADDCWLPQKLAMSVEALERRPDSVLAFTNAIVRERDSERQETMLVTPRFAHSPSMHDLLSRWWPILPSTVVVRRDAFVACGGFCEEFRDPVGYEDVEMWIRMRERGEFEYIAQPLAVYDSHNPAGRMAKYEAAYPLFIRRMKQRYGRAARLLINETRRAYVSAFGYEGLRAMRTGDRVAARRNFMHALYYSPLDGRTALRLLRTFLPYALARRLSGKASRNRPAAADAHARD